MNNNRNSRRRGRGHRSQSAGGNQMNRIDSRARGNAPQLLDKYKKLAQDAQHNGDRVQAEYYLQFADHYFRVIADNKARQEEARAKRSESRERSSDDNDESDESDNPRSDARRGGRRGRSRREEHEAEGEIGAEGEAADQESEPVETAEKTAESKPRRRRASQKGETRSPRGRKPRDTARSDDEPAEIDSAVLPPAIGGSDSSGSDDGDALEAVT
ncbi:MAG: DUF4167 domain-containing protein [Erythrobacter sp.]|uniref:DUF4167 domain-containing protein n=1 Tax=Erythrobacter sp. TaxID=1042 RepID=UPI00261976DD|nr:DUF4167 domain-containing protein [Erythrobacter sp.]MDJ0979452.1 DUF4167 domain-containing protein [Erythrobacter sp.]